MTEKKLLVSAVLHWLSQSSDSAGSSIFINTFIKKSCSCNLNLIAINYSFHLGKQHEIVKNVSEKSNDSYNENLEKYD